MITVKEEFVGGDKWQSAIALGGAEAIQLWLAMKRHCSVKLTDGFVATADLKRLLGAPKRTARALKALIECGATQRDGTRGAGLVDVVPDGWELHDYGDHSNSSDQELLRREKARVKKQEQRLKARQELDKLRSKGQKQNVPGTTGDKTTDCPGGQKGTNSGTVPGTLAPTPAHAHTGGRPREPNPAQPSPAQEIDPLSPLGQPQPRKAQRDRFLESFNPVQPQSRPDVQELHRAWLKAFGRGVNTPLVVGYNTDDAQTLADRIDASGLSDCLVMVRYAPEDDKVAGRTDSKGEKHESIRYLFGNNETFSRLLRDAHKRAASRTSGGSAAAIALRKASE